MARLPGMNIKTLLASCGNVAMCEQDVPRKEVTRRVNSNLSTIVRLWEKYQETQATHISVADMRGRRRRRPNARTDLADPANLPAF